MDQSQEILLGHSVSASREYGYHGYRHIAGSISNIIHTGDGDHICSHCDPRLWSQILSVHLYAQLYQSHKFGEIPT